MHGILNVKLQTSDPIYIMHGIMNVRLQIRIR